MGNSSTNSTRSVSSAVKHLEEKLGLDSSSDDPMRDTLYRGVSKQGHGRAAYLRQRAALDVRDRFAKPVTETHGYDYGKGEVDYRALRPQHGKKPVIVPATFR